MLTLPRRPWNCISCPLSTDASSELNVFGTDSDPLCMDSTKVSIFHQLDNVVFRRLLQGQWSLFLDPQDAAMTSLHAEFCVEVVVPTGTTAKYLLARFR